MAVDEQYPLVEAQVDAEQLAPQMSQAETAWLGRSAAGPFVTIAREVGDRIGNSSPGALARLAVDSVGSWVAYHLGR